MSGISLSERITWSHFLNRLQPSVRILMAEPGSTDSRPPAKKRPRRRNKGQEGPVLSTPTAGGIGSPGPSGLHPRGVIGGSGLGVGVGGGGLRRLGGHWRLGCGRAPWCRGAAIQRVRDVHGAIYFSQGASSTAAGGGSSLGRFGIRVVLDLAQQGWQVDITCPTQRN